MKWNVSIRVVSYGNYVYYNLMQFRKLLQRDEKKNYSLKIAYHSPKHWFGKPIYYPETSSRV